MSSEDSLLCNDLFVYTSKTILKRILLDYNFNPKTSMKSYEHECKYNRSKRKTCLQSLIILPYTHTGILMIFRYDTFKHFSLNHDGADT